MIHGMVHGGMVHEVVLGTGEAATGEADPDTDSVDGVARRTRHLPLPGDPFDSPRWRNGGHLLDARLRWVAMALDHLQVEPSISPGRSCIEWLSCGTTRPDCSVSPHGLLPLLLRHGSRLVNLDLSGNREIDDEFMNALSNATPLLQEMYLDNCPKITDVGVLGCMTDRIRALHLGQCKGVTEAGVVALVEKAPQIESLCLNRHPASWQIEMGDRGLEAIGRHLHQLHSLDVAHWNAGTAVGIRSILHGCPCLTRLNMVGCDIQLHSYDISQAGQRLVVMER